MTNSLWAKRPGKLANPEAIAAGVEVPVVYGYKAGALTLIPRDFSSASLLVDGIAGDAPHLNKHAGVRQEVGGTGAAEADGHFILMPDAVAKEPVVYSQLIGGLDKMIIGTEEPLALPTAGTDRDSVTLDSQPYPFRAGPALVGNALETHALGLVHIAQLLGGNLDNVALGVPLSPGVSFPWNVIFTQPISNGGAIAANNLRDFNQRQVVNKYPLAQLGLGCLAPWRAAFATGNVMPLKQVKDRVLASAKARADLAGGSVFFLVQTNDLFGKRL